MGIKAIFLDFYGTVVEDDTEYISKISSLISDRSEINTTAHEIGFNWSMQFFSMCLSSFGNSYQTQRSLEITSLKNIIQQFKSRGNAEELCSILFSYWQDPVIFMDSIKFFKNVAHPIILVSNIDRKDILHAININKINALEVITSEDSRYYKPRREIFDDALKKMRLHAEEVVHIGDSWGSDVIGAKNAGIKSIWINQKNKPAGRDAEPIAVCSCLTDTLLYI
jgi:FMN phosphatase YigB (HAD superfamily)